MFQLHGGDGERGVDDHRAADPRLADGGVGTPARSIPEEILDGDSEVVVRIQEPRTARDNAVAIVVGIVAERDECLSQTWFTDMRTPRAPPSSLSRPARGLYSTGSFDNRIRRTAFSRVTHYEEESRWQR